MKIIENFDIESRAAQAKQNFLNGYNCCQAVLLAFADVFEADKEILATAASGLGGGMARMREVCGTVSAIALASGFISPATRPEIKEERTKNYALVQKLAAKFREENGSIVCRELLGLVKKNPNAGQPVTESPEPSDRTPEYYRKRPCAELVECSARIIATEIKECFQEQQKVTI